MADKLADSSSDPDYQTQPSAVSIVAIGASAGGLEAFTELLKHLPSSTGLAYVYIQHQTLESLENIISLLSRHTEMPMVEAGHLVRLEPNQVYVIPPEKGLEVKDGLLVQAVRLRRLTLHMPIDQFFTSLAERQKASSIAVILSGLDGDGTQGLKAIKAAGGFTFAQDETARYKSMPKSAIAEGVIDRVLPPAEIARELERLSRQPAIFQQTVVTDEQDENNSPDEELKAIISLLRRVIGVDFSHYKVTTIRRRIVRRMMLHKLETLKEYAAYIRQHTEEATALYSDLLINVTSFFRDTETMDYLKKVLLPQLIRDKPSRELLRIWVPACSTGQEAYSIAILLLEVLGERAASISIQIFATDLSEQAIAKARLGAYSRSEVIDVSAKRLQQFFTKTDDHYRINKSIRDLCVFAPHNLFRDPPFSRLNLVSCRNLLIYLDNVLQRKALSTFHYALNPEGYLVLGKSETVGSSVTLFTQVEKNYKVYARKNDVINRATFEMQPTIYRPNAGLVSAEPVRQSVKPISQAKPPSVAGDLEQLVDNLLFSKYIPASVVVNAELDILQFRGSTSLFLEPAPGKASLNLLRMARPSLTFELRNAVHKAGRQGQTVRKTGLEVKVSDQTHYVAIEATPLFTGSDERLFLITFQETSPPIAIETSSAKARSRRIKELEEELAAVRRDMHAIIEEQEASNEELQSANEEIVSSNEELQSINEELETSKEEIESTNEELLTINHELQVRNEQLTEAYEFAESIFATLREATLVLDPVLRVKNANRTFYELFGVLEEQIEGRLFYELGGRQWDSPVLRELLDQVVTQDVQVRGFELNYPNPDGDDKTLLLNARKVVRQGRQEAILLAIEDITEHRQVQRLLEEREAWFHNIADNAPALIWVSGSEGSYTFFNRVWLEYTGRTMEDELVRGWALDIHSDDRDAYQAVYQLNLSNQQPFQAEYRLRRRDGEYRWMLENARPTFDTHGHFTGYIGSCTDIHLQKTLTQELDRRVRERTEELTGINQQLLLTADNLQAVLNNSPAAIAYLKAVFQVSGKAQDNKAIRDFTLVVVNDKFAHLIGQPLDQLPGQSVNKLETLLWNTNTVATLTRIVETNKPVYEENKHTMDGQTRWLGLSAVKHDTGVVITVLDITDLKRAEEQRLQLNSELKGSQQTLQNLTHLQQQVHERRELLRSTTHDLRGSVGVIQSATQLINLSGNDEERAQMLAMLQRNVDMATQMLTQLLDFSRIESGQEQPEVSTTDIAQVLRELAISLRPIADEKGLVLDMEGPEQLLVDCDPLKVRRIAQNLLLNALKYTDLGRVLLSWQPDESGWYFQVKDSGPGLPIDLLNRLTGKPSLNSSRQVLAKSGEGIGLFIVRGLVDLLGGKLLVASQQGLGTEFTIHFPTRINVY